MIRVTIDLNGRPEDSAIAGELALRAAHHGLVAVIEAVNVDQPPFIGGAPHLSQPDPDATQAGGPPPPVATREGSRRG